MCDGCNLERSSMVQTAFIYGYLKQFYREQT